MNQTDQETVATIALLAAMADGTQTKEETAQLAEVFQRLGINQLDEEARRATAGQLNLPQLAARLSGDEARKMAYDTALAVIHSDGAANAQEMDFINQLRGVLGLSLSSVRESDQQATALAGAGTNLPPVQVNTGQPPSDAILDDLILKQAMLTGALEILPDRLANVAILPLQLRLVYMIGQHFGQKLDANQVKDLAGTLGLGAAAQVMESVVRKVLGGIAGGILGGMVGGVTGLAAGAAVSFSSTYALGHVAKQYYAQGRRLSGEDLRRLFARFQDEAKALFPKVRDQVQSQARSLNLQQVLASLQGK
ncbi:MAG TPA: TerB family tellurite resistance protein [Gemmatimonadales bacterium]|jgi:tellurite resistance protein/uncharacterized protein (DUF697 family)